MTVEPEGFPEFWALWRPHRRKTDGRGKARPAYAKAILAGYEPETIITATRHFIDTLSADQRKFIPLASTWLNGEPFQDILDDMADAAAGITHGPDNRISGPAHDVLQRYANKQGSLLQ